MEGLQGKFFWYDLVTPQPERARAFYAEVAGWTMSDFGGSGSDVDYTILSAGPHNVGGIMKMPDAACGQGARPGWIGYIQVENVDDQMEAIRAAGGTVRREPEDIASVGRFAVVEDPGGAVFQLLTPLPRDDVPAPPEAGTSGTFGWHELYSGAGEAAAFDFYSSLFGWETFELMDMGAMGKYRIVGRDGIMFGGLMDRPEQMPFSTWNFYINVDGIDAAVDRLTRAGGSVAMGPHEVPGGSWVVQGHDPEGAFFSLVSLRR